jgi:hypothetical protein
VSTALFFAVCWYRAGFYRCTWRTPSKRFRRAFALTAPSQHCTCNLCPQASQQRTEVAVAGWVGGGGLCTALGPAVCWCCASSDDVLCSIPQQQLHRASALSAAFLHCSHVARSVH